jgi:protocatechuate 3,4-dioxygenase alpha subunit
MRTPSQTVGPYFTLGLSREPQNELPDGSVRLTGRVLEGDGAAVADAVVEVWDPQIGFGRCGTDVDGEYSFLLPPDAYRLAVMVFARGLLKPVITRLYVRDGVGAEDASMVAHDEGGELRFDVHLQGERETAFFEL